MNPEGVVKVPGLFIVLEDRIRSFDQRISFDDQNPFHSYRIELLEKNLLSFKPSNIVNHLKLTRMNISASLILLQFNWITKNKKSFVQFDNYCFLTRFTRATFHTISCVHQEFRDFAKVIINFLPIEAQHLERTRNSETSAFN